VISGSFNVVEAYHRNILWYAPAKLIESSHCPERRNIVEGKQSSEGLPGRKQFLGHTIALFRRRRVPFNMHGQLRRDRDPQVACYRSNRIPAYFGVRDEVLPLYYRDFTVSELNQMPQSDFRRAAVVENNVGDSLNLIMAGDCGSQR
jgi:hypothetical protein